jgi:hypothetical protein
MGRSENRTAWKVIPGNIPWTRYGEVRGVSHRPAGSYRAARRNFHFERPKEGNRTPAFREALRQFRAEIAEMGPQ